MRRSPDIDLSPIAQLTVLRSPIVQARDVGVLVAITLWADRGQVSPCLIGIDAAPAN